MQMCFSVNNLFRVAPFNPDVPSDDFPIEEKKKKKEKENRKKRFVRMIHEEDITVKREKINYVRDVNAEFEDIFNYELLST